MLDRFNILALFTLFLVFYIVWMDIRPLLRSLPSYSRKGGQKGATPMTNNNDNDDDDDDDIGYATIIIIVLMSATVGCFTIGNLFNWW